MNIRPLTKSEFKATMIHPMTNVTETATDVLDIWPYVTNVPESDLEGHTVCKGFVQAVERSGDERFDHVLVGTHTKNVFLVIVVDLVADGIYGHRLLNLNKEYGL